MRRAARRKKCITPSQRGPLLHSWRPSPTRGPISQTPLWRRRYLRFRAQRIAAVASATHDTLRAGDLIEAIGPGEFDIAALMRETRAVAVLALRDHSGIGKPLDVFAAGIARAESHHDVIGAANKAAVMDPALDLPAALLARPRLEIAKVEFKPRGLAALVPFHPGLGDGHAALDDFLV